MLQFIRSYLNPLTIFVRPL